MGHFRILRKNDILSITRIRRFETKLGERVTCITNGGTLEDLLKNEAVKYVIVGIPEDIGVLGNQGTAGTSTLWERFLSSFLNIQSNDFLEGHDVAIAGFFDFSDLKTVIDNNALSADESVDAFRHALITVDEEVEELIKTIVSAGKLPIVIGGGHNNSYPLIKGSAKGLHKTGHLPLAQINCINLDAHADFRPSEGRHSGNGFRYAEEDGYLLKYCIIGLHESYLPQNVWLDIVNNPFIDFITYEDIYLHSKHDFIQAIAHATNFTEDNYTGIEVDLDAIEGVLSSAATPSGIPVADARRFMNFTGLDTKPAYVHICEGATTLADGRQDLSTGKLVSFLVADFLKASNDNN
jgi:formiminoglutamase